MAIKLGNIDIQNIYLGSNPIQGVYLGSQEIWSNTPIGTFYIDNTSTSYNFIIGSTWEEFINSEYNIGNFFSIEESYNFIYSGESPLYYNNQADEPEKSNSIIENNHIYIN